MSVYHFPPNLKSKPTIIVWEVKDIAVIVMGSMISFYFLLSNSFVLPSVFVITYAVMTIRVNEYTILSGVINALNYVVIETQEYDWERIEPSDDKHTGKAKGKCQKKTIKPKQSNVDTAVKKKRVIQVFRLSFAVLILLLTTATGFVYYHQQECAAARKELYDQLNITFANIDWVEYGTKSIDAKSLIIDSHGEIRADPELIDPSKLSTITIDYTVSGTTRYGDEVSKTYQKVVEIKDTVLPIIEMESEKIILPIGQSYNGVDNIKAVYDPVDGPLKKSETLDLGTYMITGSLDPNKAGTYTFAVDACDRNGKTASEYFYIEIRE